MRVTCDLSSVGLLSLGYGLLRVQTLVGKLLFWLQQLRPTPCFSVFIKQVRTGSFQKAEIQEQQSGNTWVTEAYIQNYHTVLLSYSTAEQVTQQRVEVGVSLKLWEGPFMQSFSICILSVLKFYEFYWESKPLFCKNCCLELSSVFLRLPIILKKNTFAF